MREYAGFGKFKMRQRRQIIYLVIRYALLAMLLFAVIFFIFRKTDSDTPFETMSAAVSESLHSDRIERNSMRFLKKNFNLSSDDYEGVLIYTPLSNMDAEEVLLIKLKSTDQADSVRAAIESRMQAQREIYEGYAPLEVAKLDNAVVDVQGNYVLYAVGDFAQDTDKIFRDNL